MARTPNQTTINIEREAKEALIRFQGLVIAQKGKTNLSEALQVALYIATVNKNGIGKALDDLALVEEFRTGERR